jgi:hypothetical protein
VLSYLIFNSMRGFKKHHPTQISELKRKTKNTK